MNTQPWWNKYDEQTLETVAKKYWEMYSKLIDAATQKWTQAYNQNPCERYGSKKMAKIEHEYDLARSVAQPLLEEWINICQKLNKVIR